MIIIIGWNILYYDEHHELVINKLRDKCRERDWIFLLKGKRMNKVIKLMREKEIMLWGNLRDL